jgi:hypothetical protein
MPEERALKLNILLFFQAKQISADKRTAYFIYSVPVAIV